MKAPKQATTKINIEYIEDNRLGNLSTNYFICKSYNTDEASFDGLVMTRFCTFPYYWASTKLGFGASTKEVYCLPEGYTNTSTIREQVL
jgi:hypothetical protein